MKLICYPLLNVRSQKCMVRKKWKWGWNYTYVPRKMLIERLARQLKLTEDDVRNQLAKERQWLLKHSQYY